MAETPFDLAKAHRWFAVECNNQAWDLYELPQRTAAENERMIHAAHAACFHWLHAGDDLHHLRAQCLLSSAYAAAGLGKAAVRHAQRCLQLSHTAGDRQTPFDRATAHGCAAVAYALAGQPAEAGDQRSLAEEAAGQLSADDRGVFDGLFPPTS